MTTILVAAQPSSLRVGLRHLLEGDHHTVLEATSGSEVLRELDHADLLICAEGLEDHDAVDLCRYAQERAAELLPALLLCRPGSANLPARTQGMESFALLQMPFASRDLHKTVDHLLAATRGPAPTREPAPRADLEEVDGLLRAVTFSPSGRMTSHWGGPVGDAVASHLRTFVAAADGLLGSVASDEARSLVVESERRLWVLHELTPGEWLALEVEGGRPLGPARLYARRAARQLASAPATESG